MAREVLIINGHDWSRWIRAKGYGWSRNDLDSENTKRVKSGELRRDKIGTKRKLQFTTLPMPRDRLAALDDDLSASSFQAQYLDIHGVQTRRFYCSSFDTSCEEVAEDEADELWMDAKFNLIEI